MRAAKSIYLGLIASIATTGFGTPAWALSGVQVGASGKTYASTAVQCALHPVAGMAPVVQAGLYNPRKNASATVALNGTAVATVTFIDPDSQVWLVNGPNAVTIAPDRKTSDSFSFDASSNQVNYCIPDTQGNVVAGDLEYAASQKSYATVIPGCAFNALTGRAQPYVNLFDGGTYVLNVSVNNAPLTQLGSTRRSTPVFLAPGLNVVSATNGALSTDYYVRDGGSGTCALQ